MTNYRKTLYTNYFTNQAGREYTAHQKEKFEQDRYHFGKEILNHLPADKTIRVLDIGCGIGGFLAACKLAGYRNVEGIDLSEEMIKIANEFGVTEAKLGDLNEYLKDKNAAYDVITGMDIIEHFTKDELLALIETIKKALKPNGMVIFRTPNLDSAFGNMYANGDFTHENYMNKNSATQLMMAMGFKNVEVLPSFLKVNGLLKEMIRKVLWKCILVRYKLELFASARTDKKVVFTPNMIIVAKR
jgi:2-polyprenyl-3-methyl-5-hydroxy-6-metoxy-1,4-benzoquinol methylase